MLTFCKNLLELGCAWCPAGRSQSPIQPPCVPMLYHGDPSHYRCDTECKSCLDLSVGYDGTIHLWEPFTTIKIYVSTKTHPTKYKAAVCAVQEAINDWNAALSGPHDPRPRFQQVETKGEATCQVKFKRQPTCDECDQDPKKGEVLAHAFFPDQHPTIILYTAAFKESNVVYLKNVLNHELVHVQGVRHYFAVNEDKAWGLKPSTEVGEADEFSISNYLYPLDKLTIKPSDVSALAELYAGKYETIHDLPVSYHKAVLLSAWKEGMVPDTESVSESNSECDSEGWYFVEM
ncbi:hypothetical protein CC80DRAFT_533493 [Byssothecium circinans]|uniref:Peptidase M10 metallopeptidase domain-containing protein n=1 Tax=Byssothecium circinans TaxID=147558 RepID=A0A6A5U339_9PLEO|nr:hypothetical protein CC80DRAFT_533493 [Byssothecium circinans]